MVPQGFAHPCAHPLWWAEQGEASLGHTFLPVGTWSCHLSAALGVLSLQESQSSS